MREYRIDTLFGLPTVRAVISGPKRGKQINLLFDTGAAATQVHTGTLHSLGFSFSGREPDVSMRGVTGPVEAGFSLRVSRLFFLGQMFHDTAIAAFDLGQWAEEGIDGLLGFDLIRQFHIEMLGPAGLLKVF
jgi:Aspartyl protease